MRIAINYGSATCLLDFFTTSSGHVTSGFAFIHSTDSDSPSVLRFSGLDALAYDPHKFAMDYHSIGFRECAAEVARYLVTVEGMDIQDPLRLRLMSHLQCFAAQRELATKQASTAWNYNTYSGIHDYPGANSYDVSTCTKVECRTTFEAVFKNLIHF